MLPVAFVRWNFWYIVIVRTNPIV